MKKLFGILLATVVTASLAVAGDKFPFVLTGFTNTVSCTVTSDLQSGYIEKIYFDLPTTYAFTGAVQVTVGQGECILTESIASDSIRRPRVYTCDTNGTAGTTNSVRVLLVRDPVIVKITATIATNAPTTARSVTGLIWLDDK